jgi:hypothetical protein
VSPAFTRPGGSTPAGPIRTHGVGMGRLHVRGRSPSGGYDMAAATDVVDPV